MKYLHTIVERGLLLFFLFCFSLVSLYVPHQANEVPEAEAAYAMEWTQIGSLFMEGNTNVQSTISASADTTSASMETSSFALDNVIDGVAWALAKNILSQMTSSIVNWVNSGFKGSPAFVQDISNFMLEVTDQTMGQYLEDLGGPFSFICSPFKLDVRVALAISYEQVRSYGKNPEACTLTGALANIENFIDGTQSFVEAGGWDNWLSISANPTSYTPYGNLGAAQAEASARIVNAKGDEMGFLGFGNGFLSSKICETVEGAGSDRENCFVSTPGKVVQDALTFSLESGPRSLVEADEINEIIAAVFAQLTQKAVTGAAGLLGLSGGTGYTYTGVPMTQQVTGSGLTADPEKLLRMMLDAQAIERDYQDLAVSYGPRLIAYALAATDIRRKQPAQDAADEIYDEILDEVDFNLRDLQILIDDFQASQYDPVTGELRVEPIALQDITQEFFGLPLHTAVEVDGKEALWEGLLR